jgi:UPF0755 protein
MKKYLVLILFSFLFIFFLGISFFWLTLPVSEKGEELLFNIKKGEGLKEIAFNLEKQNLIKSAPVFEIYVLFSGNARNLQAGNYFFSSDMKLSEIVNKIVKGEAAKISFTIPEGYTINQIEEKLGVDLPGENLEGFLFPDTYQFFFDFSGEEVVEKMKNNFEQKISQEIKNKIEERRINLVEVITMASLIEKEVNRTEDKKIVSGILWKRLKVGMPLQVDASLVYILNGGSWDFNQMRREISLVKNIDSPYNTYKYLGLPPGPICNPGLESIEAAVFPQTSDYWYYLSTTEGETIFSKNLNEHNIAVAKYLK